MDIVEKALRLLEKYPLCDSCVGRHFALLGVGLENNTRGRSLKNSLLMWSHSLAETESNKAEAVRIMKILAANGSLESAVRTLQKLGVSEVEPAKKCFICSGILDDLDGLAEMLVQPLKDIEFRTFLVGSMIPPEVAEREDVVRSDAGSNWCEALKREVNREVGKRLMKLTGKEPEFRTPDITLSINPFTKCINILANPLFIRGRYRKLVRGIPQATWLCRKCRGAGCPDCDSTGRMYEYSVQEFISKPFLDETRGRECKFHGAGREDIDARMLGNGRPFIIEIKEPKKRFIDLSRIADKIALDSQRRVEVLDLRISSRDELRKIKTMSMTTEKTYRALVSVEREVGETDVERLVKELSNTTVRQVTPLRVLHRRADKLRVKKVYGIEIRKTGSNRLEAIIRSQGGLYVKELVSGDSGRTTPSFSQILEAEAKCVELDVIDVADQFI